jgi:hypothetical protein
VPLRRSRRGAQRSFLAVLDGDEGIVELVGSSVGDQLTLTVQPWSALSHFIFPIRALRSEIDKASTWSCRGYDCWPG